MLKKYLLVILAASLIACGATIALAQDSSPNNQPAQANGGWHHGAPPDPAQRTQELTKKLNLTADQQTKVQSLFESERSQMETLHQDSSLSQQDRRSKMMDIHKTTDTQIRALLDPDQQKTWDKMQANREQWGRHHGAPNGDQQSPPPQL